ncbi:MAG: hypothetical protein SD837_03085 [Candidatus Electrothrix scaldis]|nr:MAG: hypothetical protein SD837_03085 [Candidatus Electrothrix sp. GW3-3]
MKVIVDTSVWSLALRRNIPQDDLYVNELKELIKESRVQLIGPVRQELLNGIKHENDFNSLKDHLRAFKDLTPHSLISKRSSENFTKPD